MLAPNRCNFCAISVEEASLLNVADDDGLKSWCSYLLVITSVANVQVFGVGARAVGVGRAGRRAPGRRNGAGCERAARCNNNKILG